MALSSRRDIVRQPFDQPVHGFHPAGDVDILDIAFRPAPDLAGEVIARLAEITKAQGFRIEAVQPGKGIAHRIEMGAPILRRHIGEGAVPDDPAFHAIHHIEPGADDAFISAQAKGAGHRESCRVKGGDHPIFPIHGVRRFQQLPGRFAPQHIGSAGRDQLVGRVRLAALELAHGKRPFIAFDMGLHPCLERAFVEPVLLAHIGRSLELRLPAGHVGHGAFLSLCSSRQPISRRNRASAKLTLSMAA